MTITPDEAESAIECLFELNPQACWNLLCCEFELEDHASFFRGLICDRFPYFQFSLEDAQSVLLELTRIRKPDQAISWKEIENSLGLYLRFK